MLSRYQRADLEIIVVRYPRNLRPENKCTLNANILHQDTTKVAADNY